MSLRSFMIGGTGPFTYDPDLDYRNETPVTDYVSAAAISFVAETGTSSPKITDPNSLFLTAPNVFYPNAVIEVRGSTNNDGYYLASTVEAGTIYLHEDVDLVAETAGAGDVTISTPVQQAYRGLDTFFGSSGEDSISDKDGDTSWETERGADDDTLRGKIAGTDRITIDANGVTLEAGASVNEFSTDDTLAGDSDDAVPTEKSVKAYADTKMADLVDDTTPQLGGDLDLNGKNIDFPTTPDISDCLDEDNMASDSPTMLVTQQSVKAYVDAHEADTTAIHGIVDTSKLNTSDAVIVDHTLVRGDGGAQKVQDSGIIVDDSDNVSNVGTIGSGDITITGADNVLLNVVTTSVDNAEYAGAWFYHSRGAGGNSISSINQYEFDFKINADESLILQTNSNDRLTIIGSGDTKIGDGGATNYTQIAADGEITLFGTARVKKQIPIANANLGKGGTKPNEVIIGNYNAWEYGINDDSVFTFHIPHDWAAGTDIIINVDWYIDEPAGDEIKWQITYSATPHNSTEAIDSAGTSIDTGDIVIPTTPKFLTQNALTIPAAALAVEDQVGVTLKRIAITDGTNPASEPGVVDVHIEYTSDKMGEAT